MKRALLADNGDEYFRLNVQGAELTLKGLVLAAFANGEGKSVMLAMSDVKTAELTLVVPRSKAELEIRTGTEIEFIGIVSGFTKSPFMLTIELIELRASV